MLRGNWFERNFVSPLSLKLPKTNNLLLCWKLRDAKTHSKVHEWNIKGESSIKSSNLLLNHYHTKSIYVSLESRKVFAEHKHDGNVSGEIPINKIIPFIVMRRLWVIVVFWLTFTWLQVNIRKKRGFWDLPTS